MLFSILSLYLFKLPLPGPDLFKPALMGFLEITTGIDAIARSGAIFSIPVQSGAMAACAAFGGLSGIAQTNSVIRDSRKDREKNAGLSIRHYIFWKALHSLLSCIFLLILWKLYASSFFSS